jgi:hypothetical protein
MTKQQIEIEQLKFGTTNGTRQPFGMTKIRIYLSKPLLKKIESTTRDDQTKSERICELIIKGMKITKEGDSHVQNEDRAGKC